MNAPLEQSAAALTALETRCRSYAPLTLDSEAWAGLRDDAIALVLVAGDLREDRARKDLALIAAVAGHLSRTRVSLTLENVLSDATLAAFDSALAAAGRSAGTRQNQRGRLRRLQAASRDLPWRRERRHDGQRLTSRARPDAAQRIQRLLPEDGLAGTSGAAAVQAALDHALGRRRGAGQPELDSAVWAAARRHAACRDVALTKRGLAVVATYEVLDEAVPAVVLLARYGLTRRDLALALVLAAQLPTTPSSEHAALLRG